ncbi:hypothetical protein HanXRQr2_Chr06g0268721 [Helianthus annuus]|uniref:Uncharacterized protein n=1 Tax=Helianthus annuus TaxID=4232 RepID=A0A9K3IU87_HELAN|nr:hypothetical protein HanXRQr2_Chr06g0268721 [Helianthus annuus]KAJ0916236.1 hypothetical protein HanPSC8_Chr06g0259341 [Helianthus annuus]
METNQLITLLWSVFWLKPYGGMCVGVDYALLMEGSFNEVLEVLHNTKGSDVWKKTMEVVLLCWYS